MENTLQNTSSKINQPTFQTCHDAMFRSYHQPAASAKPPQHSDFCQKLEYNSVQDQQRSQQVQTQQRMYGSTTLFDRSFIGPNQRNKVQKSVIVFRNESGVSLGDLEQMKISNMNDIKKETEIVAQELGENLDDKQFKDILKNESTAKRLSIRLSESALNQLRQEQADIFPLDVIQEQKVELTNEEQIPENLEKQYSSNTQNLQENDSSPQKKSPTNSENDLDEEDEIIQIAEDGIVQQVPIIDIAEEQMISPSRRTSMRKDKGNYLPPLVSMSGYLKKRSPKYLMGWQKRWLQFTGSTKTFMFKSADPVQPIEMWYAQVLNHIKQSKGFSMELRLEAKHFWRDDRISLQEFQNMADTGDLILFRGKAFDAKLQRAVTGSEFDHVAIVLKYSTSDIFIMEALGGKIGKVILFRWSLFQKNKWYEFYDKIVYRRLTMQRTSQVLTQLETFIQFALNKKYKFTIGKIMRKKTSEKEESESNDKRTFFCSELAAQVFKKLGILNESTASSAYLPGDFSLERDLKLQNDAKLSHEQVVDFSMKA